MNPLSLRPTRGRRIFRLPLAVAGLAVVLAAGCSREPASAPAAAGPVEVTVATLETETVTLTRELPGRTTAFVVAEVRPQVTGIVEERLFTEGGMVKAGDPLYRLEGATYRAAHQSAEASLARAHAALEFARLNAERAARLSEADAVSRQENENAIAELRQAEAQVAVAEAAVTSARVTLGYTVITSPISGRIGKSSVTQGALVTANQETPLATVQQLDPIYVDLYQSSREWLDLQRDLASGALHRPDAMPVTILLEDGTNYQHAGKLAFSEVTVDPTTGSFGLRVLVPNPDNLLLPGMYVRAIVGLGIRENAILAPQPGITRDPRGDATAMVVSSEGTAEMKAVKVSRTVGNRWLVESGLAAGDRVIVAGLQKIRPGAPVTIAPAPTDAAPGAVEANSTAAPAAANQP